MALANTFNYKGLPVMCSDLGFAIQELKFKTICIIPANSEGKL